MHNCIPLLYLVLNINKLKLPLCELVASRSDQNLTKEHPWSRIEFWSSFHGHRRRQGNLKERKNRNLNLIQEARIKYSPRENLKIPRKKRFNNREIEFGYFQFIKSIKRINVIHNSPVIDQVRPEIHEPEVNRKLLRI